MVVAYGKRLLASTLRDKTDFGTFEELLANKRLSAVLELDKFQLSTSTRMLNRDVYFYLFRTKKTIT